MSILAHLCDGGWNIPEGSGHVRGFGNIARRAVQGLGLQFGESRPQLEVLQSQGVVRFAEREIVLDALCGAPDRTHEGLGSLGEPRTLELTVVVEHTQRSYLQKNEDSCIDQCAYDVSLAQGPIS